MISMISILYSSKSVCLKNIKIVGDKIIKIVEEWWFQSNFYLELHNELQQGRHTHIFMRSHINIYRDDFKTRKIFDSLQSMNVRYFVLFSVKLLEFCEIK